MLIHIFCGDFRANKIAVCDQLNIKKTQTQKKLR